MDKLLEAILEIADIQKDSQISKNLLDIAKAKKSKQIKKKKLKNLESYLKRNTHFFKKLRRRFKKRKFI
jgi:hypothetical protein